MNTNTISVARQPVRVIHLEDNRYDQELVEHLLLSTGIECEIVHADNHQTFQDAMAKDANLIISDYSMPGYTGLKALEFARETRPTVPFIFFSGTIGEEAAIDSLRKGATDYVLKQRPDRLATAIQRALNEAAERAARQRAETKIKEQAALLDKAQDAIFVCNLEGRITYWNEGAARFYGWTLNEVTGKPAEKFFFKNGLPGASLIRDTLFSRGEWHGELAHVTKDGRVVVMQSRQTLVMDDSGAPASVLHINTDITEKKQMEARLLRTQRMENLGSLAGGIAHDLNNILTPMMLAVEIMRGDSESKSSSHLLQTIAVSTRRGADLVKQILSFALGSAGEKTPVQLQIVAWEIKKLIGETFPRSITIRMDVPNTLPGIMGDSTQLHQVLLNLCINARDAMMPQGGVLSISAATVHLKEMKTAMQTKPLSGEFVELKVSDTGTGIPQSVRDRIFEPFFTTKARGHGTGLGLSTVLNIVNGHGGCLDISSQPGEGTTFSIWFPVAKETATHPGEEVEKAMYGKGETVLIIDDESAITEITSTTLSAYNYQVLTANNGMDAIDIFTKNHATIDVVIADLMMPVIGGAALIKALRAINPRVKLIAVSGFADQNKTNTLSVNNLQAFLNKPFTSTKLLATLRSILDSRQ